MKSTWHPHGPLGAVPNNAFYDRWQQGVPIPFGAVPNSVYYDRWRDGVPIPYGAVPNNVYTSRWRQGVPIPFGAMSPGAIGGGVATAAIAALGLAYGWQVWQATSARRAPSPKWLMYVGAGSGIAFSALSLFGLAAGGASAAMS
jgi:hypothetical protein